MIGLVNGDDLWVPEAEFFATHGHRLVVDVDRGQLVFWGDGRIYTEVIYQELSAALIQHPDAELWTEHLDGDGSLYYSRGIARINRSGCFLLVNVPGSRASA